MATAEGAADRDALDRFYTPEPVAEAIVLRVAEMVGGMTVTHALEPSSGHGSFLRVMGALFKPRHLHAVDLDPEAKAYAEEIGTDGYPAAHATFFEGDFLKLKLAATYDVITGNPPFARPLLDASGKPKRNAAGKVMTEAIAQAHIERQLQLLNPDGGVCAALVRASFLATPSRFDLFKRCPPRFVDHVVQRPSFTEGGTDAHEYVVIYWQRLSPRRWAGKTETRWLSWK